ncbi:hypothetical protein CU098_007042 [Rhizopus stolonifer]|uniref:Phosducin domain-containing protein n=1 Tax=Rhizopus stolonifer TaxID=4846 RepID=A0A367KN55_RHIST|nr:hypothetical protein CU098_007042 [Rhizopus stolonifer]
MEDALWAQIQNASLEDNDKNRIEPETDSEDDQEFSDEPISHSTRQSGPQTGPKGVKADYDYHQQIKLASAAKARAEYNARILAKAPTTTTYAEDQEELLILESNPQLEEDEDEAAIRQYREKRLRELKQGNHAVRKQHKMFGFVATIDGDNYAHEIDNEWKTVPVIVHIFDERLHTCKQLDDHLRQLCQKYTLAKFIRVSAEDLDFDLVGSPTILAYQGGLLIANLVRIIDQVGSRFDVDAIEDVLLRNGALSENDLYEIPKLLDEEEDDEEE